jgi:serine/threonine protein kinase
MAIIISPSLLHDAAKKFTAKKMLSEKLEAHILNFYEDLGMPLSDLNEVIDSIVSGELEEIQEKMDGQNITFTVMNGQLFFLSKGANYERLMSGGGMNRDVISSKYSDNESVRSAFMKAYNAIEPVALKFQDTLFQNGRVFVESALLTPENPNTVVYDEPTIRFIQAVAVAPDTSVDQKSYAEFVSFAQNSANEDFALGPVPYLKLQKSLEESDVLGVEIKSKLLDLVSANGLSLSNTMGDLALSLVRTRLATLGFIPDSLLDIAASKIVTGKGSVARPFKTQAPTGAWDKFQQILKNRNSFLAESIIPIENIIQQIGFLAFRNLEFSLLASNRDDLVSFIKSVRGAFETGKILADPKKLEGIRVSLDRIGGNEDLFEKSVEGIVFKWKGQTRKLTGLFTPINKLRGFFAYGKAPATIEGPGSSLNELQTRKGKTLFAEGGNAFKDDQGNIVTRHGRTPRSEVSAIVSAFQKQVLDPVGLTAVPVGSTGTDTETVGDIDVAVAVPGNLLPARTELFNILSKSPGVASEVYPGIQNLKALPGLVAVLFQVPNSQELIQIDVIPSDSVEDTAWLMKGGIRGGVKGVYRNLLLSYVAKKKSELDTQQSGSLVKHTIALPGGLATKIDGQLQGPRITDPDKFLPALGINAQKSEIETFESLVDFMRTDANLNQMLPGFEEYMNNPRYLQSKNPTARAEAEKAIAYINLLGEGSFISEMIKKILNEGVADEQTLARMKEVASRLGYEIGEKLGEGKVGDVYLVQKPTGQRHAMKVVDKSNPLASREGENYKFAKDNKSSIPEKYSKYLPDVVEVLDEPNEYYIFMEVLAPLPKQVSQELFVPSTREDWMGEESKKESMILKNPQVLTKMIKRIISESGILNQLVADGTLRFESLQKIWVDTIQDYFSGRTPKKWTDFAGKKPVKLSGVDYGNLFYSKSSDNYKELFDTIISNIFPAVGIHGMRHSIAKEIDNTLFLELKRQIVPLAQGQSEYEEYGPGRKAVRDMFPEASGIIDAMKYFKDVQGWQPKDVHAGNVMMRPGDGTPVIVDLGLFQLSGGRSVNLSSEETMPINETDVLSAVIKRILNEEAELTDVTGQIALSDADVPPKDLRRAKSSFKSLFLSTYKDFKGMNPRPANQPKEVRLGHIDSIKGVTPDEARKLIAGIGYRIISEIPPRQPGSKTSKGITYLISKDETSPPFSVVFGSANKGEKFESELRNQLMAGSGPISDSLLNALGLSYSDILSVSEAESARPRPLTGEIRNDGPAISDITLNTSSKGKIYLSIKNPAGGTYSNPGYGGGIVLDQEGRATVGSHQLDDFVEALGIDKNRIVQGINDFISNTASEQGHCPPVQVTNFNAQKVANYLAASFGYGYTYARQMRGGDWHIMELNSPQDVISLVGKPVSVVVSYARYDCSGPGAPSSKGTRAKIETDTGARFDVAIRNKSGSVIPNQMAITISKYPTSIMNESEVLSKLINLILSEESKG